MLSGWRRGRLHDDSQSRADLTASRRGLPSVRLSAEANKGLRRLLEVLLAESLFQLLQSLVDLDLVLINLLFLFLAPTMMMLFMNTYYLFFMDSLLDGNPCTTLPRFPLLPQRWQGQRGPLSRAIILIMLGNDHLELILHLL